MLVSSNNIMTFEDDFVLVKQGAEAKIFRGVYLGQPTIVKERFKKNYRHSDLDEHLTKERIKNEARSIVRSKLAGLHTPSIYLVDFVRRRIYMQDFTDSVTVKDYIIEICQSSIGTTNGILEEQSEKLDSIAEMIGKVVGKMHANNIIHGDLTTSNMLLVKNQSGGSDLVLIDFGLSYSESVPEDKGVDLYVLERAILSTHTDASTLFPNIITAYLKENSKGTEVIKKLDEVRARGRKRTMVG